MILDKRNEFADAVAVTGAAGTNLIGNVVDNGSPNRDLGQADQLFVMFNVDVAFAGGTSFQFVLASDSAAAIATDGTETRHGASDVFTTAQLTQGFRFGFALPFGATVRNLPARTIERYLGILGIGVGTHTAGSISAYLTRDKAGWIAYPDGNN